MSVHDVLLAEDMERIYSPLARWLYGHQSRDLTMAISSHSLWTIRFIA
jgi:hypothetical protein